MILLQSSRHMDNLATMTYEQDLESLKVERKTVHERNIESMLQLSKLLDTALDRMEKHKCAKGAATGDTEKAKMLLAQLKHLCNEREKVYESIKNNQKLLEEKYKHAPRESIGANGDVDKLRHERDQAFELAKRLLAVLRSAHERSKENAAKSHKSADVLFHVMYKVEDTFLPHSEETK